MRWLVFALFKLYDGYMKETIANMQSGGLTAHTLEVFMAEYDIFLTGMKKVYYRNEVLTDVE